MFLLNSFVLILILCGPIILPSKAWELNQLCQQTCWGFDCVKRKPTQVELCGELEKNRLKCCSQYTSRNTTTTTPKPCQEDVKSQFKEKKRKKKQEGWFLNDACQTACYVFSCLFGTKPTEEELCQVLHNRYNDCCSEIYSTSTSTITENTGGFFTELLFAEPDFSSESDEHAEGQKQGTEQDNNKEIPIIPSTTTSEENEEVEMDDETTTDVDIIVGTKSTRNLRVRSRKPGPNRKSKNQKYMKLPDA